MTNPFLSTDIDYPAESDKEDAIKNFHIDTLTKLTESNNSKEIGIYFPTEVQTGQSWPKEGKKNENVNGFRLAKDIGPLPGAPGSFSANHDISGITETYRVTEARAIANRGDPFSAIPLEIIEITSTKIIVNVTAATINYESCIIVIEYIKSH